MTCGARVIEKHIILDKTTPAPDQNVSIDPLGLHDLVDGIRKIEDSLGSDKSIHAQEEPIKAWARRSVVSIQDIKKGETLTRNNIWSKRPGSGIPSKELFQILNKKATRDLKKDSILTYSDFE